MVFFGLLISCALLAVSSGATVPTALCPIAPASLAPCVCMPASAADTSLANATLDCSAVTDPTQFATITGLTTSETIIEFGRILINNSLLTELPAGAFGQAVAEVYEIINSQISVVQPKWLHPLAQPLVLDLVGNMFSEFPFADLQTLNKIEYILLGGNQLAKIPPGAFENVGPNTLRDVILSHNKISEVGARAFGGVHTVLNAIVMNNNEIGELLPQSFCVDSSPNFIVLNFNKVAKIASDAFTCGTGVSKHIALKNNLMTTLEHTEVFDLLSSLSTKAEHSVDFSGNPLKCDDCLMKWIQDSTFRPPMLEGVVCMEPREVAGTPVVDLPATHFNAIGCV